MSDSHVSLEQHLSREMTVLDRGGFRRTLRAGSRHEGGTVETEKGTALDFASNDYLGLAADPRLGIALRAALEGFALGGAAARLISGDDTWHHRLEERLARYKGTEAALLFPTGFAANTGAIPALARRGDVIYTDRLNHASLIDACRLSRAETKVFGHADLAELAVMLETDRDRYTHRWIVVDGVFSMDGDLFPLDGLVPLARRYGAWIYLDDAHGTGVLGANGRGTAEHFGVADEIDVTMGTLGKAFGVMGGFVAGSAVLRDWLLNRARAFVFTTATPPALAAATIAAIDLAEAEPWRRDQVRENARLVRSGLAELGHQPTGESDGHIIPVPLGSAEEAVRVGQALHDHGILVGAVRPPTVPLGGSRLRITVSALHTKAQIDRLLSILELLLPPSGHRS